ncbi:hypothetical protein ONS95_010455 [Cadophora gregata]|uniref:uncharacterized protein n=1 Tax=Cadophora gregata TaxID=51156 RepID=UPI0026DD65B1|nr:uncharacterized protein ONS95_010455 [Cadophora gregata]KAK0122198.1 hypothetical protein ONS95_010455 [Cadophora gregata]KAK0127678.1 hypothetical protein ONS96_007197 [Cadophora gregata f. sp. sojae]
MCWPSVGGMIIVDYISSVEFQYLDLDKLEINQRSYNSTEEDNFCRQLRRTGGKWWKSYDDWGWATQISLRRMSPTEKEVLHIGWPETGGVWLLRFENKYPQVVRRGTPTEQMYTAIIHNATTMEERCRAIERCGGEFFEDPRDSQYIRPLLDGFGEHDEEDNAEFRRTERGRPSMVVGLHSHTMMPVRSTVNLLASLQMSCEQNPLSSQCAEDQKPKNVRKPSCPAIKCCS